MAGEICPGGETQQADSLRVEFPFSSVMPHKAQSSLGILHRQFEHFFLVACWRSILQQHGGDAQRVEPFADVCSFVSIRQEHKAAAGGHNHRCTVWLFGPKDRDGWITHISDPVRHGSSVRLNEFYGCFRLRHHGRRRSVGPKLQCDRLCSHRAIHQKAQHQEDQQFSFHFA